MALYGIKKSAHTHHERSRRLEVGVALCKTNMRMSALLRAHSDDDFQANSQLDLGHIRPMKRKEQWKATQPRRREMVLELDC